MKNRVYFWKYYINGELGGECETLYGRNAAKRFRKYQAAQGMLPGRLRSRPA